MAIIKCKMCGGDMELSADKSVGTCEYCGSTMTIPKVSDEQRAAAFDRGNHFRRLGEFDKALSVYERIIQEDENDAEAHWCCALCRFGIEYVKDPASGEYLPTCHRASFDSFLEDVDYKAALAHADAVAKEHYQADGEKIAAVQRGILATVQKEEPFDVFICYKESDERGQRTVDSTLAQDIYYQLTEQGRRVFFARITLEDKAGQEYEPYIFAALHSAKVMIVVGTKPEYLNAVWVKNEWSRYLTLMKQDRKRLLIPCYRDMDPYDLPEQLSVLQSHDMGKIGFIQDLIRGVSKVLGADKKPAAQPETVVVQGEGNANLTALLKRGNMALEDGEWSKADEFFDRVLDLDAECAEAYLGKALAAQCCQNDKALVTKLTSDEGVEKGPLTAFQEDTARYRAIVDKYKIPGYFEEKTIRGYLEKQYPKQYGSTAAFWQKKLSQTKEYFKQDKLMSRAVRYAKGETAETIKEMQAQIEAKINEKIAAAKEADRKNAERLRVNYAAAVDAAEKTVIAEHEKAAEKREADYAAACKDMEAADTEKKYLDAAKWFDAFGDYKDSKKRGEKCKAEAEKYRGEKERRWAEEDRIQAKKQKNREKRRAIIVSINGAVALLAVAAFLIVLTVVIPSNDYKAAEALLASGDYDGAAAAFAALGDYKGASTRIDEVHYAKAEALLADGHKSAAAIAFGRVADYSDARERAHALWDEVAVRDTVSAGGYHTVILYPLGVMVAEGSNEDGQCDVSDWSDIVAVSAGTWHTIGLRADGTVVATGYNGYGQCDVSGWSDIVAVSAGYNHTVGLKSDGTVIVASDNSYYQRDVSGWSDIVAVSAGDCHTIGLKADGTAVATGGNEDGRCDVSSWSDIVAVSAGYNHTVGLKSDGTVIVTGDNSYHQCDVSGWSDIVAVSAGENYTVGLKADDTVVVTGYNGYGQCDVSGWSDIVAVSAGYNHTVGLKADGTVVAKGDNEDGQCDVSYWSGIMLPNK